jgi:hypothetical protein
MTYMYKMPISHAILNNYGKENRDDAVYVNDWDVCLYTHLRYYFGS